MELSTSSNDFLHAYLNASAPVGQESDGQQVWLRYVRPFVDDCFSDVYGTVAGVINPEARYKLVLEAHADEIAWYVNYISKSGYIHVIGNGGSDYEIAPSMYAKIRTQKGDKVPAVFGWPALHVRERGAKAKKPGVETVVLDGGFGSKEEVLKRGINIGDIVTFEQDLVTLNSQFWVGRALDNRMGGFAIAEVARLLHEHKSKIPFGVYFVNAVQEEVGHRGARMIAERIRPDVALVTDVTHCTDSPLYNKTKHGEVSAGKGPVLGIAPATHPNFRKMLIEVADKHSIPFQREAHQYVTGTDTDTFAYSHQGVASALLSTPLRYMHTTVEMVHQQDVAQLIQWMYQFVIQLEEGHSFAFNLDA